MDDDQQQCSICLRFDALVHPTGHTVCTAVTMACMKTHLDNVLLHMGNMQMGRNIGKLAHFLLYLLSGNQQEPPDRVQRMETLSCSRRLTIEHPRK